MNPSELTRVTNRNIFRSKMRTLPAVPAIFVGALTLVLTNGLGDGRRNCVLSSSFTGIKSEPFESDESIAI